MSRDSFDDTAQGWAEITELLTVAGGYIPTLNPPGAVIENTCEGRTYCLSHTPMCSVAIKQKSKKNKKTLLFKVTLQHMHCMHLCMCCDVSVHLHEQVCTVLFKGRVGQRGHWQPKAH